MMLEHTTLLKEGTVVALYARVSTEKQEREETIESQIKCLKDFAKQYKYIIHDIYQDDGYSGELLDRPDLDRLRDHAEQKRFKAVLIYSWDRLSREHWHQSMLTEKFNELEIPIISIDNPQIADTPERKLQRNILGSFAEYEKEKIADRTRRGKLHKARQGILITSKAPYGYKYIMKNKGGPKYTIIEKEASVVKEIFRMFNKKQMGMIAISRKLFQKGIVTQNRKKIWSKSMVARVLSNTVYIGKAYYYKHKRVKTRKPTSKKYLRRPNQKLVLRPSKEWIEIPVPRIIDNRTFVKAQDLLKVRKLYYRRPPKHKYMLSGLMICAKCGHRINSTPYRNGPYYRCGSTKKRLGIPKICDAKSIKADKIEQAIWRVIERLLNNPSLVMKYLGTVQKGQNREIDVYQSKVEYLDKRIHEISEKEERYYELYSEGEFNKDILKEKLDALRVKKNEMITKKQTTEQRINSISTIPSDFKPSRKLVDNCLQHFRQKIENADFHTKREILRLLTSQITYADGKVVIKGYLPIFSLEDARLLSKSSEHYGCLQPLFRGRALHDVDL